LSLSSVNLEPPQQPRRQRLDQEGSFEAIGPRETIPEPSLRGEHSFLEGPTISDLGAEALGPYNSLITNLLVPLLIYISPPGVTHHEHQIILQATMEENDATSSGSPHTPSMTTTTGGVPPPKSPSQVQATMVSTASTSSSGLIPSMVVITTPFMQSVTSPPFSYRMPNFDKNSILSYSTLQNLCLGARCNDPKPNSFLESLTTTNLLSF
jgi:hypothetical protein